MPDDHYTTAVMYYSDNPNHTFTQITDVSDINYGKDFDIDMETVLNPE